MICKAPAIWRLVLLPVAGAFLLDFVKKRIVLSIIYCRKRNLFVAGCGGTYWGGENRDLVRKKFEGSRVSPPQQQTKAVKIAI